MTLVFMDTISQEIKKGLKYMAVGFLIGGFCTYKVMNGMNERYMRQQSTQIENYARANAENLERLVYGLNRSKSENREYRR